MTTKTEKIASYYADKAVQDNIVEDWCCVDCGVNTNPGCPDGPTTRIEIALTGESKATMTRDSEVYAVKTAIWKQVGMRAWNGCLCIGCLEQRLGRQLRPKDFARDEVWAEMPCTERNRDGADRRRPERDDL
jgi:hypothetical protein